MPELNIVGLSAGDPKPGVYAQIRHAQGPSTGFGGLRAIVLEGNPLDSGSATANTVFYGPDTEVSMVSEQDCIDLFGAGSEIHRMYLRVARVNQTTPVYAIAIPENVSAVQATRALTFSGTATGSGTVRLWVGDEVVETGFITDDGYQDVADAVADAVNGKSSWAISATASLGILTLTAKNGGPRGNKLRVRVQVLPTTAGISVSPAGSSYLAGGSGADDNTTALATIASHNFYYHVSAANDSTQLGDLAEQIAFQALALQGNRQRAFAGSNDSSATATALAVAINNPRVEIGWLQNSDASPPEMAAAMAAVYALFEAGAIPRLNFDFFGSSADTRGLWTVKAPLDQSKPSRSQIVAALNNGVTPIGVGKGGTTWIERAITSYNLNGDNNDYRVRDHSQVTVPDFFMDDLVAEVAPAIEGKNIGDDPVGEERILPNVFSPRDLRAIAFRVLKRYDDNGLIERVAETKLTMQCTRSSNPSTRLVLSLGLYVRGVLHQVGLDVAQL